MVRYKATISYDGRLFAGFQRQPSERSVQEELEKTLQKLNSGNPVKVHGAGRTDSGVHAYGQVVHFDLPQRVMWKNYDLVGYAVSRRYRCGESRASQ